jgi:hypothetical protein
VLAAFVPEAVRGVRRYPDRVSSTQLAALAGNLEYERPRDDLCPALLLGVDVDGLSLGARRIHGVDAEQFGAKLDEGHPLAGTRVRDLLAFVRHRDRSLLLSGSGAGFVRQPPSTTGVSATPLKRLPFPRAGVTRSAAGAHQLVGAGGATLGCRTRDALDGGVTVVEVTKQTGEVAGTVWLEGKPTARDAESPAIL